MRTKENTNLRKNLFVYLEEIKKEYTIDNIKKKDIAKKYGVSEATLGRFLKENNINKNRRNFTGENKDKYKKIIENLLLKGYSQTRCCEELNISEQTFKKILDITESKNKGNSNKIDDSKINFNDADFCYLLGLFIADGHMDSNTIYVSQSNPSYLHKLQEIFSHKGTIHKATNAENPCYTLHMLSIPLRNILEKHGVQSNKKLNAPYIDCGKLQSHFIRGLFDGDGCISYVYTSGKFTSKSANITTGSKEVCEGVAKFLKENNINYTIHTRVAKNLYYVIDISTFKDVFNFADIIYKNKNKSFLEKKYYKFVKLKKLFEINQKVNEIVGSVCNDTE